MVWIIGKFKWLVITAHLDYAYANNVCVNAIKNDQRRSYFWLAQDREWVICTPKILCYLFQSIESENHWKWLMYKKNFGKKLQRSYCKFWFNEMTHTDIVYMNHHIEIIRVYHILCIIYYYIFLYIRTFVIGPIYY